MDCDLCTAASCPADRCGLSVEMASDCNGLVDAAEVAVDECVEPADLAPSGSVALCSTVPKGKSRVVRVRSDDWAWQRTVKCSDEEAGNVVVLTLHCETP